MTTTFQCGLLFEEQASLINWIREVQLFRPQPLFQAATGASVEADGQRNALTTHQTNMVPAAGNL